MRALTPMEIFLMAMVMVQFAIIYGLINRLVVQSGLSRMKPVESIEETLRDKNAPVASRPRPIAGSQRITP